MSDAWNAEQAQLEYKTRVRLADAIELLVGVLERSAFKPSSNGIPTYEEHKARVEKRLAKKDAKKDT